MRAIKLQATIKEIDVPYIEKILKEISAEEVSFKTDCNEFSISKELEKELEKRYESSKKSPEKGISLEDLNKITSRIIK